MTTKKINLDAAIKTGWQIVTKNLLFFIGLILFLFLVNFGENFIEDLTMNKQTNNPTIFTALLMLLFFVFNLLIGLGFIKIAIEFVRNQKAKFSDLFSCVNLIGKYFVAALLVGLITVAPIIIPSIAFGITLLFHSTNIALIIVKIILGLLVIAGAIFSIYLSLRLMFYKYFIVDKNCGIVESLSLSSRATGGVKWQLLLYILICLGIMLLGFIALFVGILVAIPITMVASAAIYLQLSGQIDGGNEQKTAVQ